MAALKALLKASSRRDVDATLAAFDNAQALVNAYDAASDDYADDECCGGHCHTSSKD
jgi:hypothetical protein